MDAVTVLLGLAISSGYAVDQLHQIIADPAAGITVLAVGFLLGRYSQRWRATVDRLIAEHRAAKRRDVGLHIIHPPVTRAPRSHRRRRTTWADMNDVFPAELPHSEPQRIPDGPTLELARLADDEATRELHALDEANERLADLPHFRQQEQQPK
jgi:hypothetical protein